jgi:hypothetical protein
MTEATMNARTETAVCAGCGAALADDQRYCLHCGDAQGGPRVAYRELIAPAVAAPLAGEAMAPTAVMPAVAAPPAPAPPRDWTPLLALGVLGVLALVLVVGVLIGKSGTETAAAPAGLQVITLSGAAPATTTPTTADASGGGRRGGKAHARAANDADPVDTRAGAQAVRDLDNATGDDYQRKSARLPDTVALPGEPPPRDDKAPGGGSGAETIE